MTTYEICVRGEAPPDLLAQLAEARQAHLPAETLLITERIDQDGLMALITRIRDLGLELRGLRCWHV